MEGYQRGEGGEEWGCGKVQGIGSIIGRHKIDRGVLSIVGNREAKELICRTHGHEVRGVGAGGWRDA